ncbi:MAG: sulfatase-like hydrolase/transferase [Pseudomonadota bacterium]|nr:sulfatase-like hydrolase/transferase [Pseudomonadota bacterium]
MSETIKKMSYLSVTGFFCAIFWVANLTDAIADERPNIVIILADDLGWADVGYHGSDIETPNIDRIAKEGVKLNRFYATPFCSPTRAALMTGRDPLKLGVAYSVLMPWENGGVSLDEHFLPQSFQSAGYNTAMVGKWHLGHTIEQHTPNARGFDHFYGHMHTQVSYFDHQVANGHDFQENGKPVDHNGEYATDVHGEQAARFITDLRDKSKPFMLYIPFLAPHSPMEAPEELKDKYPFRLDLPGSTRKTYAAMVDSMDQAIGKVLTALDEEGVADNTIVFFFSDNGGFENYGSDNGPYRGGKLEVYEGGIRVTAVMRWPEKLAAGSEVDEIVSVLDMLPTLTHAAGVDNGTKKKIDGVNRWSTITGENVSKREGALYFASNIPVYNKFQLGVIDGKWKLVQNIDHKMTSIEFNNQLFDLEADPYEKNDLTEDHPAVVKKLNKKINEWRSLHPIGGSYVKINPHPGWRAPKDYADVIIPAEKIEEAPHEGFGQLESIVLQRRYGDKGRIKYE